MSQTGAAETDSESVEEVQRTSNTEWDSERDVEPVNTPGRDDVGTQEEPDVPLDESPEKE